MCLTLCGERGRGSTDEPFNFKGIFMAFQQLVEARVEQEVDA